MSKRDIISKIKSAGNNIRLWSDNNPEAISCLRPDLGQRDWNALTKEEKQKIWRHLCPYMFDVQNPMLKKRIEYSIRLLNYQNKYNAFAKEYLAVPIFDNANTDFYNIFHKQDQHTVLELLSYYLRHVLYEKEEYSYRVYKTSEETEEEFEKRSIEWLYDTLDWIIKYINEVFEHFGVNICVSRQGFLPRQEPEIMEQIYEPVLKILSSQKWEIVNRELKDAFSDYLKKTEEGYSSCVTHTISAIEAFLQILNNKNIGKDKLNNLIKESIRKGAIPNDIFTQNIFKNIESILVRTRQETSDAHPKKEYATEKNARLILNLAMIFIQHCLQA